MREKNNVKIFPKFKITILRSAQTVKYNCPTDSFSLYILFKLYLLYMIAKLFDLNN